MTLKDLRRVIGVAMDWVVASLEYDIEMMKYEARANRRTKLMQIELAQKRVLAEIGSLEKKMKSDGYTDYPRNWFFQDPLTRTLQLSIEMDEDLGEEE